MDCKVGGVTTVLALYTYDALNRRIGERRVDAGRPCTTARPAARLQRLGDADRAVPGRPHPRRRRRRAGPRDLRDAAWYLGDRLGTIRDLVNNSGTVVDHVDYTVYGGTVAESAPSAGDRFVSFAA